MEQGCCPHAAGSNNAAPIKLRFSQALIAGIFGIALMVQSIPFAGWITLAIMLFSGWHIYLDAIKSLVKFRTNMNTLITLGTGAAWIYSMLPQAGHTYFESAVMILAFIDLGSALEIKARGKTAQAINKLMTLQAVDIENIKATVLAQIIKFVEEAHFAFAYAVQPRYTL